MSSKQISIFLTSIVRAVSLSPNAGDDSMEPVQESPSPSLFSELLAISQHLVECTGSQMLYAMEPISTAKKGVV